MKILIVDDTVENIKLVSDLLADFDTSFARCGEEALVLLEEQSFDLILLDVMMPGLDGFETCVKLRELPLSMETPVIFLTAKNDNESIVSGFKSGGQDFITKPFSTEELRARVKSQLISKRMSDSLRAQLKSERTKNKEFEELFETWQTLFARVQAQENSSLIEALTNFNQDITNYKQK